MNIDIIIENEAWGVEADFRQLAEGAIAAAVDLGGLSFEPEMELSLVLSGDAGVQALNKGWRGKDKPTNVLSFPAADLVEVGKLDGLLAGDIVFAYETIRREAELEQIPFEHHFSHLAVHGLLHLFGHDHETHEDARIMESLETRILAKLGMADPYKGEEPA